jgi:lysylphosphatidylglycerol synthetase-like protein (DUF2156 family)
MTQITADDELRPGTGVAVRVGRWRYFEPADLDGIVAFELHRDTAVVCGDPACAPGDLPELLTRFTEYCQSRKWRFAFVGASARVGAIAAQLGFRAVNAGEDPAFDLARCPSTGNGAARIHLAANGARVSGVIVDEYTNPSPAVDAELDAIAGAWLASRKSPPMGFLMGLRPSSTPEAKRIFVARFEGRIVGAVTCSPVSERATLCAEELIRRPEAPIGTGELLIEEGRAAAMADGLSFSSVGASALHQAQPQPHGSVRAAKLFARALFMRANVVARLANVRRRDKAFSAPLLEDSFFIYGGGLLAATIALAVAFSPGGFRPLALPQRMQWLRFVPAAALWTAAVAGVFLTGFAAWEFPVLTLPVREVVEGLKLVRFPADTVMGRTSATLLEHRIISAVVIVVVGAAFWQRRARA